MRSARTHGGDMLAIARHRVSDTRLIEALMPGAAGGDVAPRPLAQKSAISILGLTPGVAFTLAPCCHPIPGDRIVGLRREDEGIEVHTISCDRLADGVDADWVDLAWGDGSDGGTARVQAILANEAGALGRMAGVFGGHGANIVNLHLVHRDESFHTFDIDLEVHDVAHLVRILAGLRGTDGIAKAERV